MGIKIAVVGVGSFAHSFIPLLKAHPRVERLALCDLDPTKLSEGAARYGIRETYPSLDAVCQSDLDAVFITTQHWMHAPQAIQSMRAGKDAYSAVPAANSLEEMNELLKTVQETGRIYMMGETSYYYPEAIYCRDRYKKGDFGHIVYGEAEYIHDWDEGLYDVMRHRAGPNWRTSGEGGSPPMYYPTHSMSMIVSVTGAHATHVSCHGFVDTRAEDRDLYGPGTNRWNNPFSNQTALFRMSDGSSCRINEFRRIGHRETERMNLFGTEASFEHNDAGYRWLNRHGRETLDDLLQCKPPADFSAVHPVDRLPEALRHRPGTYSHFGSHSFLVDDFVTAVADRKQPPVNVWEAARYLIPGLIAHESSMRGGELLPVPDLGIGSPVPSPSGRGLG